jgi:hypothetical protein
MRRREDNYLGTEHVLLGIGGNKVGTAVRILASIGVSLETSSARPNLDVPRLLKATLNVVEVDERALDDPEAPNIYDNGSIQLVHTSRSGQPNLW